jgi:hypothetical protein
MLVNPFKQIGVGGGQQAAVSSGTARYVNYHLL